MTSNIKDWPNKDPEGLFEFSDGFSDGYNLSLKFERGMLNFYMIKIKGRNVVEMSDPVSLNITIPTTGNPSYVGVKLKMIKIDDDPKNPLLIHVKKIYGAPFSNTPRTLPVDAEFDGKLGLHIPGPLIPNGPTCGFIGATDARQISSTTVDIRGVNLDWRPPLNWVKLYCNPNGPSLIISPQDDSMAYPNTQNPISIAPKNIPIPKWGVKMDIQHY